MGDRIDYDGLSIELPEGWANQTVVTFVGPRPSDATPLHVSRARTNPPSIVLKEVRAEEWNADLDGFLAAQDELMTFALLDAESAGASTHDGAPVREYVFGPAEDRLRQALVYVVKGPRLFVVCGTAPDDLHFEGVRRATLAVASSLVG